MSSPLDRPRPAPEAGGNTDTGQSAPPAPGLKERKKRGEKPALASIFRRWLLVVILATFAVVLALTWRAQTRQSDESYARLLHNVVQNVAVALNSMDDFARANDAEETAENIAEFYGAHVQAVRDGGILIVKDGRVIGDAIVDYRGKSVAGAGIPEGAIAGGEGSFHATVGGQKVLCYYETLNSGLTVISMLPHSVLYAVRNTSLRTLTLSYLALFTVLFIVIERLLRRFVVFDINRVNNALALITEGKLDERANADSNREFAALSAGINTTVDALKDAIAKEAARLDDELRYACAIQLSALPRVAGFADTRFSLAATMRPAREVGGDFYDFFFLDENTLALVVADVSGKGIPAALYMMGVMQGVHGALLAGGDLPAAFAALNEALVEENSEMFVTVFAAVVNLQTGRLTTLNAGHNSPLLCRAGGAYGYLPYKHDFVLGGLGGVGYHTHEATLSPGDVLFAYTDGVTECMDTQNRLFGEDRLKACLDETGGGVEEILAAVEGELSAHAQGADPFDDITMLCFTMNEFTAPTTTA